MDSGMVETGRRGPCIHETQQGPEYIRRSGELPGSNWEGVGGGWVSKNRLVTVQGTTEKATLPISHEQRRAFT